MKLYKEFFRYVIPSMLAFALSGLYGIVDGFFLGNEMGDAALAAINVAYPIIMFIGTSSFDLIKTRSAAISGIFFA